MLKTGSVPLAEFAHVRHGREPSVISSLFDPGRLVPDAGKRVPVVVGQTFATYRRLTERWSAKSDSLLEAVGLSQIQAA